MTILWSFIVGTSSGLVLRAEHQLVSSLNTLDVFLEQSIWFAFCGRRFHSCSGELGSKLWFSGDRQERHPTSALLTPAKH